MPKPGVACARLHFVTNKHVLGALVALALAACNGKDDDTTPKDKGEASKIDLSLCDGAGKRAGEYDLNKDNKTDVWHLFNGQTLTCKQFDFDRDGRKDWVVAFNAAGTTAYQRADFDFDGKFDMLAIFQNDVASEIERDTDFDGKFDVKEIYDASGQITSVRRDRNTDTKPDVWEEYRDNQLVAIKYDDDYDGKVDRTDDAPSTNAPVPTPPPADPSAQPPASAPEPAPAAPTAPAPASPPKK